MVKHNAHAAWRGTLREGSGTVGVGSGTFSSVYDFTSRFQDGKRTNPEELLGAALAGCYAMALSSIAENAGHKPAQIDVSAEVSLEQADNAFRISSVRLKTVAEIPDLDEKRFEELVGKAKRSCIVAKALTGTEITVNASLREPARR